MRVYCLNRTTEVNRVKVKYRQAFLSLCVDLKSELIQIILKKCGDDSVIKMNVKRSQDDHDEIIAVSGKHILAVRADGSVSFFRNSEQQLSSS